MKRNNAQNSSAKKKLIPAVAMFTASAVMLSTATYAWFTMNKEVQVTGLNMTATAGRSLEISLGEITGNVHTNTAPTYNSESWQKLIAVSDYYDSIGKLKPASSNTGNIIYTIPDADVYGGGTKVKSTTTITAATKAESAEMVLKTGAAGETADIEATEHSGYYIDVPMWIRCSASEKTDVKCAVTISDPNTENGSDLTKAVRVAVIPVSSATTTVDGSTDGISGLTLTGSADMYGNTGALEQGETAKIYGTNFDTYNAGPISKTNGANFIDNFAAIATGSSVTANAATNTTDNTKTNGETVFTLNADNTKDVFSGESFIVRVWLEGESKFCNDATSEQDWNINFDFYIDEGNEQG